MKIFNNIKILYKILLTTKFRFAKPKKIDFLLYDQGIIFNKIVRDYLKKYEVSVLHCRFEELNIYVILNVLIKLKFLNGLSLFQNYIIQYCKLTKPKIILSSTVWDEKILVIKKYMSHQLKIMFVQMFPLKNEYFQILKNKKNKIDYFFYFDNKSLKIVKKYFVAKFIKIGSFRNNDTNILKNKTKNKNILLISGFKKNFITKKPRTFWELNIYHEKKILEILYKILAKNHQFKILLKPDVSKKDYLKFMNCDQKILISNKGDSYNKMEEFDIVIGLNDSTMCREALSRGIKSLLITKREIKYPSNFYEFNKKINYENIKKFIKYFSSISTKKYFQTYQKMKLEILTYDYNNLIFRKTLIENFSNLNEN
tara:strand:- start:648 stop:1754 length:1107 start_codon:yes stop_codon:yes gene_type:complete